MSPIPGLDRVGLLGGGVIGGGWAARFLLNGVDVQLFDPDPEAPRKVGEVLDNARRALLKLVSAPLPAEGTLTFVDSPEAAATGVDFVQESAPERMELKQQLLQRASAVAGPDVVFGSSTSGLLPTEMQHVMTHPERLVVGHPFNPVYLMPLVEVVGGERTSAAARTRAAEVYDQLGMQPVQLSTEIDGFVADRLMEALWREALWMINDGVATASEIDDCVRFGPGLRWSFMGTFLTYRIAGGEAGMRHFMAQFGPSLKWPWSKLTDVPELTDELLDTLVAQSDVQAAGRGIRELERQRDDSLVAVFHGLRSVGNGAGLVLDRYEQRLTEQASVSSRQVDPTQPLRLHEVAVPAEWVDYNGHMNDSRYFQLSSETVDAFLRHIGLDDAYLAGGHSWFTVESHLNFVGQARQGDRLYATVQVLSSDDKRVRVFTAMHRAHDDALLATAEHMLLHVDTRLDKACPAAPEMQAAIAAIAHHHGALPTPGNAGRAVGQQRS
ncbi:MAG TPA: carnitine 3-dehydrogenase [Acidimicrobiaceae bacterium]|nr:carnitine 3-dehydrogenase [Acidimicrobiaceae bacterium]